GRTHPVATDGVRAGERSRRAAGLRRARHREPLRGGRGMTEEKHTYCRICEVYCGLVATVEDGKITKLRPDRDHVVSQGYSCPKGINAHQVTHDPDRILHPMKKIGGAWQRISWEQAIEEISEKLNRIRVEHGPDAIALYTGNPAGYAYAHRIYSAN